jgi:hypothetical protein
MYLSQPSWGAKRTPDGGSLALRTTDYLKIRADVAQTAHEEEDDDPDVEVGEETSVTTPLSPSPGDIATGPGRPHPKSSGVPGPPRPFPSSQSSVGYVLPHPKSWGEFVEPTELPTSLLTSYVEPAPTSNSGISSIPEASKSSDVPESTGTAFNDNFGDERASGGSSNKSKQAFIGIGIPVIIVALAFGTFLFYMIRYRKQKGNKGTTIEDEKGAPDPRPAEQVARPVAALCPPTGEDPPQYRVHAGITPSNPIHLDSPLIIGPMPPNGYNTGLPPSMPTTRAHSLGSDRPPSYRTNDGIAGVWGASTPTREHTQSHLWPTFNNQTAGSPFADPEPESAPTSTTEQHTQSHLSPAVNNQTVSSPFVDPEPESPPAVNPFDDPEDADCISEMSESTLERDLEGRSEVSSITSYRDTAIPVAAV